MKCSNISERGVLPALVIEGTDVYSGLFHPHNQIVFGVIATFRPRVFQHTKKNIYIYLGMFEVHNHKNRAFRNNFTDKSLLFIYLFIVKIRWSSSVCKSNRPSLCSLHPFAKFTRLPTPTLYCQNFIINHDILQLSLI